MSQITSAYMTIVRYGTTCLQYVDAPIRPLRFACFEGICEENRALAPPWRSGASKIAAYE